MFTTSELTDAVKSLKNGKTLGSDKVTAEIIKNMGQET